MSDVDDSRPRLKLNPQLINAMQQAQEAQHWLVIQGILIEPMGTPTGGPIFFSTDDDRPRLRLSPQLIDAIQQAQEAQEWLVTQNILIEPTGAPTDGAIYAGPLAERMAKQRRGDNDILYTTDEDQHLARAAAPPAGAPGPAPLDKKPTPDDVIATYYRRHSHKTKITLKQVCEDMHVNYNSIRVAKVAYDKRRRRGRSD